MIQKQAGLYTYALEVKDLSVVLGGHKVLEIPSLQVKPKEVMMIIGPNGSGKSTLLLSLALLQKPAAGIIAYKGVPVSGSGEILKLHRRLAVVLQEPLLLNSTVWDNVTLGLRLRRVAKDEASARAKKWLERFGVTSLAKRQARMLSGGEARRVSLARAFALQPEVLFLDEPFTGLDSPTRQALVDDFESVLRETGVTTVMVTHDRNEALALADRVAVLIDGKIRQTGTPEEVFNYPVDEAVAAFVEAGNIWHGIVTAQNDGLATVLLTGGRQIEAVSTLQAGHNVTIFLKYEDITLTVSGDLVHATSARNSLTGRVTRIANQGAQVRVTLDCGFDVNALITRRSAEDMGLKTGQHATATFKASSIHLISRR